MNRCKIPLESCVKMVPGSSSLMPSTMSTSRYFALENPAISSKPKPVIRIVICFIVDGWKKIISTFQVFVLGIRAFNLPKTNTWMIWHYISLRSYIWKCQHFNCVNLRVILSYFNPSIVQFCVPSPVCLIVSIGHGCTSIEMRSSCRRCNVLAEG